LRNYWDGVEVKDEAGKVVRRFEELSGWTLQHALKNNEKLVFEFEKDNNKLIITDAPGDNLRDMYKSNKENKTTIDLILELHGKDFGASIKGQKGNGFSRNIDIYPQNIIQLFVARSFAYC